VDDLVPGPVTVSVPATSANLGPGFDTLGLALTLRDEVTAQVLDRPGLEIEVTGPGEGQVPLDERHLVHRALVAGLGRVGVPVPPLRLTCRNGVPHSRGLGSSSAAIVAGVCLARALVHGGGQALPDDAALALAGELEGHPDNVAPALLGGLTVAWAEDGRFRAVTLPVDPRVETVVFLPPQGLSTEVARGLLPSTVPHVDAAANAGRAALLTAALGGRLDLLLAATEDRLHQGYREDAMPESLALLRSLRADGVAATISGAGPSVLALVEATGRASALERAPEGWRALALGVDRDGTRVLPTR